MTSDVDLNEERLLSVLTHGSTGRNPTFFKAYGHNDVFGLRVAIPEGCTTLEVAENLPSEDPGGDDDAGVGGTFSENQNVLYVQLPEGHPITTGAADKAAPTNSVKCDNNIDVSKSVEVKMSSTEENSEPASVVTLQGKSATVQQSLSFEEAVEQAELIFDDGENLDDIAQITMDEIDKASSAPVLLPSGSGTQPTASTSTSAPDLKLEPVLSMTNTTTAINSLPNPNIVLSTAKPLGNTANDNLATVKDLKQSFIQGNKEETTEEINIGGNLLPSAHAKKAGESKESMTIVQAQKQCSVSNENIVKGVKSEFEKQVSNLDSAHKTRNRKTENGPTQNINSISKTVPSSGVVLKKDASQSQSLKCANESPATEVIDTTSIERQVAPVNRNQKITLEVGRRKGVSELKSLSNSSAMIMTNVVDEINFADGAPNVNKHFNTSVNKQNVSVESTSGSDVTDSRRKDVKIKEETPNCPQIESASENSRHHNLRPKRTLRHVHALKQQAKRRKRNTSIAAASSGATSSTNISNSPDLSTISIQRTVSRKSSVGKDNGGNFLKTD